MAIFLSPGVKVIETDFSALIPQVSTNITAYVGRFEKGPVNDPLIISNPNSLKTELGMVVKENVLDWMTARNFFGNGYGDKLYLVRVVNEDGIRTSITGNIGAGDTSIAVSSTAKYPTTGKLRIDNDEIVTYNGKTAVTFENVVRGLAGTTAVAYNGGGQDVALLPENSSLAIANSGAPFVDGTGSTGTITFPALNVLSSGDSVTVGDGTRTLTLELDKTGAGPTINGAIPVNTDQEPDPSTNTSASKPFELMIDNLYIVEVVDGTNFSAVPFNDNSGSPASLNGTYEDLNEAINAVAGSAIVSEAGDGGIVRYKDGNTLYVQMVTGTLTPGEGVDNTDVWVSNDTRVISFYKAVELSASDAAGVVTVTNALESTKANVPIQVNTTVLGSIAFTGMSGGANPQNYRDDFITHFNRKSELLNTATFSDKEVIKVYAKSPGKWGQNIAVSMCSAADFDSSYVIGDADGGLTFDSAFSQDDPSIENQEIALAVLFTDEQGNQQIVETHIVSLDSRAKDALGRDTFAETVINASSPYINVIVNPNTSGDAVLETTLSTGIDESTATIPVNDTTGYPDAGRISIGTELILYTGKTSNTFTGVTRGADGSTALVHASGALVEEANTVATITNVSLTGGSDGISDRESIKDEILSGYDLFSNPEHISVDIILDGANCNDVTIQRYILEQVVEKRKDCIAIFSPPREAALGAPAQNQAQRDADMIDWRLGRGKFVGQGLNISSSYGTIYANWKKEYVRDLGADFWLPVSGSEAGIMARTDATTEPWYAPAGLVRGRMEGVEELAITPDQGRRDLLYKKQLNPIADIYGSGPVNWGQKTMLTHASNFDRINVRRLFLVLEKAIATFARTFVFEFNDRYTRNQIVSVIRPYLRDIQGRRGIEDFLVKCDEENNPPIVRDRQELRVDIFIKPTKVAEFIRLNFISTSLGASFSEFFI